MPWELQENHPECSNAKPWAVVQSDTRERMGCHRTRDDAVAQMRALYANEGRGADSMELKAFDVAVKATDDNPASSGTFEAILSAPTLDRDGEIVDHKAFDPLPAVLPVHAFHDFGNPVGKGRPFYDGDVLKIVGTFASTPRAQEIRTLVTEGVVSSMSVGFMAAERDSKDGVTHIVKGELLEGSFVSIPSNREAAVLAAKHADVKVGARNSRSDTERLRVIRQHLAAIHDTLAELGAPEDPPDDADKSVNDYVLDALGLNATSTQVSAADQTPEQAAADTKSAAAPQAVTSMALQEAAAHAAAAQVQLLTMRNPT